MSDINLVKQSKPYQHEYGDLVYGNQKEMADYFRPFEGGDFTGDINIVSLNFFAYNPMTALSKALPQLVEFFEKSKYECSIMNQQYYGIVPVMLMTKDVDQYITEDNSPRHLHDMMRDASWNNWQFAQNESRLEDRYKIVWEENQFVVPTEQITKTVDLSSCHWEKLLLGSGYASFYIPNDGSWSENTVVMELNNGDRLVCKCLVWHNK